MEQSNYFSISLELSEVFALANLINVEIWPGISIPTDIKTESIHQMVEKGIDSLSKKEWLGVREKNGPVMLFSPIMKVVDVVKHPWPIYAAFPGKIGMSRWFYLRPGELIDQELSIDNCMQFTFSRDLAYLKNCLEEYLGLNSDSSAPSSGFTLSETDRAMLAQIQSSQAITEKLQMLSMPKKLITPLIDIITGKQMLHSFVTVDPIVPENITKTITWISTSAGIWQIAEGQISKESKDWHFIPVSSEELRLQVMENIIQPIT